MAGIADWPAYKALVDAPHQRIDWIRGTGGSNNNTAMMIDSWVAAPGGGAAPTTAEACDDTTPGALFRFKNAPSGTALRAVRIRGIMDAPASSAVVRGAVLVLDRLSHQGGLSGTVTGAQTTNLPTAALTRNVSGEGVMIFLAIYTSIGSTATTVTVSYTNQDGTSGRTSPAVDIGGTNRNAGVLHRIPLQDGDTGVRSVESVTLAASTGTAGAFGVVLARPLFFIPFAEGNRWSDILPPVGGRSCFCSVPNDACPWSVAITGCGSNNSAQVVLASIDLAEVAT